MVKKTKTVYLEHRAKTESAIYKMTHIKSGRVYIGSIKHKQRFAQYKSSSKEVSKKIGRRPQEWKKEIIYSFKAGGKFTKAQIAIINSVKRQIDEKYAARIDAVLNAPISYQSVVMLEQMLIAKTVWKNGWDSVFNQHYCIINYHCYSPSVLAKRIGKTEKQVLAEIRSDCKRLGLRFTGNIRTPLVGNKQYEVKCSEFTKWYSHGELRILKNAHARKPIAAMLKDLRPIAKEKGVKLTGRWKAGGIDGYLKLFEITYKGKVAWKSVKKLKAIKGLSMRISTPEEQLKEAQGYAKQIGIYLTGKTKHIKGYRHFEVVKEIGSKDKRWIVLSHLKELKSPFTKKSLAEQLTDIRAIAKAKGIRFTGRHRKLGGQKNREFEFELAPNVFRWLPLASAKKLVIRPDRLPFFRTEKEREFIQTPAEIREKAKAKGPRKPQIRHTLEACKADALKYKTICEWRKNSPKMVNAAYQHKWMAQCSAHMTRVNKPAGYWTLPKCQAIASKYDQIQKWRVNDLPSYDFAKRQGWIDLCTPHMQKRHKRHVFITPWGQFPFAKKAAAALGFSDTSIRHWCKGFFNGENWVPPREGWSFYERAKP